jgi:hypothetical protein
MIWIKFVMKPLKVVLGIFLLGLTTSGVLAQDNNDELRLLARPMPDSVMLRWAPTSYQLWLSGNLHGYMVSRTRILKDGKFIENPVPELMTDKPLKPAPLDRWEKVSEKDDYAGVAAQAIYGEDFEVDAGGSQQGIMEIINRASEQESKYGFALLAADISPEVARLSGLWLTDSNVKSGEKYLYKVWPVKQPGDGVPDTAYYYTGTDEYLALPSPANVMVKPGDKSVTLTWEKALQDGIFTGFWIERSLKENGDFKRLNESLQVNTTPEGYDEVRFHYYVDSLPDNRHDYFYRIVGVSPFGEEGPASLVVKVKGEKKIKYAPRIVETSSSPEGVKLTWEMKESDNVVGFRIFRSEKFQDNYKVLADSLPTIQHAFLDKTPLPAGYYRLQAFNDDGDGPLGTPRMVQVIDSIPPPIPTGLKAEVDSLGHVFLEWKNNTDPDIFGYRVFRANALHEEFSQLTGSTVLTNNYSDTINIKTLTKKIYYKILAVDKRQNWSGFSEVLEVKRPDIVPPATPLITSVNNGEDGIELKWNNSPSTDVLWQVVYRNKEGSRQRVVFDTLTAEKAAYKDSLVTPETLYRYLVLAVDSAGNESKPGKAVGGRIPSSKLKAVRDLEVVFDKKENAAKLKWTYQREDVVFLIYKKRNDSTVLLSSTESNEFIDSYASGSDEIFYSIVVKSNHSGRSGFSEFVKIKKR